jgi:hypothetical protein
MRGAMTPVAVTMSRLALPFLALVVLGVFLLASPSRADENLAGAGTVEEWRARLGRSEVATASYAAGVMAMGNVFAECKNPRTVRDLHTYLVHRALSTLTMKQAIWNFLMEADCTVISEDRFISSNVPQWNAKSPRDGGEY